MYVSSVEMQSHRAKNVDGEARSRIATFGPPPDSQSMLLYVKLVLTLGTARLEKLDGI